MKLFELKNEQLAANVPAINSGKLVFLGSTDTKNPEIKTGFFGQLRSDVSTSNTATDGMLAMFLGFANDNTRIVRAIQSYKPAIMNLKEGQVIEGLNIQIEDSLTKFYEGQKGRMRPDGSAILVNGNAIYRKEKLVVGEPKHTLITEYDHVSKAVNSVAEAFVETVISEMPE